jgi:putative FmdB family regulatory protein
LPLYEYRCTACDHKFEKIQKFSDEPLQACPLCQGELVRPMTAPALRFEGAGWYVNDYAGKGGAKSGDAPAAADSAAKETETKTESRPESKSADSATAATAATAPAAPPASTPAASTAS